MFFLFFITFSESSCSKTVIFYKFRYSFYTNCEESYSMNTAHKSLKRSYSEKQHICQTCGKSFKYKSALVTHNRFHTSEKPFSCGLCDKSFAVISILNTHQLTHSGLKTYQCDVCKRCFARKSDLKRHVTVHTGEKPFKCEQCDKCFTRKSSLTKHMLIHNGKKIFNVEIVRRNLLKGSLKRNMLTHTKEKLH